MKKSTLLMIVSVVLAMTLSLGGTLAYLQDSDSDVNVMTLGNVYIEQHEYEREVVDGEYTLIENIANRDGANSYKLVDFEQNKPLYPAVITGTIGPKADTTKVHFAQFGDMKTKTDRHALGAMEVFANVNNAVDKFVFVENTGKSDAYVRTYIAFEIGNSTKAMTGNSGATKDKDLISVYANSFWKVTGVGNVTIDGNNYYVQEYLYDGNYYPESGSMKEDYNGRHPDGIVHPGDYTYNSLAQVYMNPHATNEDMIEIDGNKNGLYDILVLSQAVQVAGFEAQGPAAALNAGFGEANATNVKAWFEKEDVNPVQSASTAAELNVALEAGKGTVTLSEDIAANDVNIVMNGGTLDGNNKILTKSYVDTFKADGKLDTTKLNAGVLTKGGTIKNLKIENATPNTQMGLRAIYVNGMKADMIVDNCVLDATYPINVNYGGAEKYNLTVSNTTLNGWTSYGSGTKAATFTDCVFGKSSTGYANLRPYCDTTLTNCSFSEGFTITRNSPNNETFTITLTDCKVGNTVVTAANFEELFDDKSDDGKWALSTDGKITVIVDGVPVVW